MLVLASKVSSSSDGAHELGRDRVLHAMLGSGGRRKKLEGGHTSNWASAAAGRLEERTR
jgi:hypothetical protein